MKQADAIAALDELLAIAPACSAEAVGIDVTRQCGRTCRWRDELRKAQRLAHAARQALGGTS